MAGQGYNQSDFANMQREAERRVMEMQRRAKATVGAHEQPPPQVSESPVPQKKGNNLLSMLNFKSLLEGKDTSLVLMVLALLSAEDTDPILMLALLYVMM